MAEQLTPTDLPRRAQRFLDTATSYLTAGVNPFAPQQLLSPKQTAGLVAMMNHVNAEHDDPVPAWSSFYTRASHYLTNNTSDVSRHAAANAVRKTVEDHRAKFPSANALSKKISRASYITTTKPEALTLLKTFEDFTGRYGFSETQIYTSCIGAKTGLPMDKYAYSRTLSQLRKNGEIRDCLH